MKNKVLLYAIFSYLIGFTANNSILLFLSLALLFISVIWDILAFIEERSNKIK